MRALLALHIASGLEPRHAVKMFLGSQLVRYWREGYFGTIFCLNKSYYESKFVEPARSGLVRHQHKSMKQTVEHMYDGIGMASC